MKNITLFLFSVFLFSATTQCMEIITTTVTVPSEPIIIQKLKKEREKIRQIFINYNFSKYGIPETIEGPILTCAKMKNKKLIHQKQLFLSYIYFYNPKFKDQKNNVDRFTLECLKTEKILLNTYKESNIKIEFNPVVQTPDKHFSMKLHSHHLLHCSALGIVAATPRLSHKQKKYVIKKLITLGFKPTRDDKKIAVLELWEQCYLIMKEIYHFKYVLSNASIPNDVLRFIYQLIIDTTLLF